MQWSFTSACCAISQVLFCPMHDFFSKLTLSKTSFTNTTTVSIDLEKDQTGHFFGLDMRPNCLQTEVDQQMTLADKGLIRSTFLLV